MTDYYLGMTYRTGTTKEDLERISNFMEHYSPAFSKNTIEQPILQLELDNEELNGSGVHEIFMLSNKTTAQLIQKILPNLSHFKFIDDICMGEANWKHKTN